MAQRFEPNMARLTAEFHVGFNIVLAIVFLPLLDPPGIATYQAIARPKDGHRPVRSTLSR